MNNNRNNRRRGRGNRNQGGNGSQLNRIDSRARGNAPQMLDKYKKLAQDAQHNGDRVQMEYYLQFADHYFRVIADNKARADEQRGGRRSDEREPAEDYADDDLDFDRGRRSERPQRAPQDEAESFAASELEEGEPGHEGEPFLADDRANDRDDEQDTGRDNARSGRPSDTRRQPRKPRAERADKPRAEKPRAERGEAKPARARRARKADDEDRGGIIDSAILPPSIRGDDSGSSDTGGALEAVD